MRSLHHPRGGIGGIRGGTRWGSRWRAPSAPGVRTTSRRRAGRRPNWIQHFFRIAGVTMRSKGVQFAPGPVGPSAQARRIFSAAPTIRCKAEI